MGLREGRAARTRVASVCVAILLGEMVHSQIQGGVRIYLGPETYSLAVAKPQNWGQVKKNGGRA